MKFRRKRLPKIPFFDSGEGKLLLVVWLITVSFLIFLYFILKKDSALGVTLLEAIACHLTGLRAGSVLVCLNDGINIINTILINFFLEAFLVLNLYPLFIFMLRDSNYFRFIRNFLATVEKAARRHKKKIQSYGSFGLFIFVILPFQMTGPMVGVILGYLMRYTSIKNLSICLGGTFFSIVLYALLGKQLVAYFEGNEHFTTILFTTLASLLLSNFIGYLKLKKTPKEPPTNKPS